MTPEEKLSEIKDLVQATPEYGDSDDPIVKQMNDALNEIIDIIDKEGPEVSVCKRKIEDALEEHDCYLACDDPYCGIELRENGSDGSVTIK